MPYPVKTDRWVATYTTSVTTAGGNARPDTLTLNGDSVANTTNIHCAGASFISVSADTTPTDNTATDLDINILASNDNGTTFDDGATNIYASKNFGDAQTGTFNVQPGPTHIRVAVDENGAGNAEPIIYITVTWGTT